jgi:beta-galactosidase
LNGEPLGRHTGGYLGFTFDVSKRLRWGTPNVLAVRVDNAYHYDIPPHTADYNFYGGLYREVELEVTHPVRVDRVVVTTPEVTPFLADVLTRTTVRNTSSRPITLRLVTSVISPYNEIVRSSVDHLTVTAGAHADMERHLRGITEPLLWDPDHPWMYRVSSTLYDERGRALDQTFEPLGFRWYRFDADSGFFLNGRPLKLRGVNLHQDHLNLGNAVGVDRKLRDLVLCKRMGANFIRLAHYPHHPAVLHFADSLGLMLWEEIPYVNTIGREAFMETAKQMLAGMIDRDRNHPSVILWGLGNEFVMPWLAEEDRGLSKQLTRELHTLAKVRDPGRLTVQAHNELIDTSIIGITDVQGRNRYYGWYEGTYDDLGPALDEEKRRFPDWKVIVSEYGAEGKYAYHVNRPETFDHSETYQMALHESSWQAIKDRPWVAGGTIWNMVDFGSFRKIGNIPHVNQKGMVTADRRPKGVYYYYQSQWTTDPMVHIVTDTWTHRSGPRGAPQQIKVYSNCDEVELLVDGQTAGRRPPPFLWNVRLIPGEHRLRAYGTLRGSTVSHDITMFYRETE